MGAGAGGLPLRGSVPALGGPGAVHAGGARAGPPQRLPTHGADLASGREGVRAYLDRCHAESLAIFAGLTDTDLQAPCLMPTGTPMATSA